MRLLRPFAADPSSEAASRLYAAIVAQARQEAFYTRFGVPDTVDGRFELVVLHVFLVLRRLKAGGSRAGVVAQALIDRTFEDMDRNLREMGAADLGVARRIKAMVAAFYGRATAYEAGLAEGGDNLRYALRRNLYGTVDPASEDLRRMALYLETARNGIDVQPLGRILDGHAAFARPDPDV